MFYLLGGLLLWYCIIFVYKTKTGSPSVWSRDEQIKRLLKYVKPGMAVADMGSGDGRVLIEAEGAGAEWGEGWEIEPYVWLLSQKKLRRAKNREKIKSHFGDMWKADLSKYDLVFVYQLSRYAPRFVAKCKKEMKKGSIVIANTYPLDGLPLIKRDHELYVYEIGS